MATPDTSERERRLDEALEATFPASDAPSNTPQTGIRLKAEPDARQPRDHAARHRFEIEVDGQTAFLQYRRQQSEIVLVHTEVPPAIRGRRVGEALVQAVLEAAAREHLQVVVVCPFVKAYLKRHPELAPSTGGR